VTGKSVGHATLGSGLENREYFGVAVAR
jgi:hypothetical protein